MLILSKPADLRVPGVAAWVGRGAVAVAASCVLWEVALVVFAAAVLVLALTHGGAGGLSDD